MWGIEQNVRVPVGKKPTNPREGEDFEDQSKGPGTGRV